MLHREWNAQEVITVLVVDDHALVRNGIVSFIQAEPGFRVVAEGSNGAEAVSLWRRHRPRITLIDLKMPIMDGVTAIQAIRQEDPKAIIVILTTYDGEADIFRGVSAGAKGYVLKDIEPRELMECLRQVAIGGTHIPPMIAMKLSNHLSSEALTGREVEVLALVADGFSNAEIAGRLYISETTVKAHMKNVLGKLDATSRTEAVALASRRGIIGR
jgi:two-component system NarL family response regulator